MKETKIEIPADCEVEKIETKDDSVIVTFKKKKPELPKSWCEFCEMFPIKKGECSIGAHSDVIEEENSFCRKPLRDRNVYPDRAIAEAVLALCQLIQLRNAYNGDFVPKWAGLSSECHKYTIEFNGGEIEASWREQLSSSPLYFKTADLRDEFLRNFRPMIEKLKPLYGIKEGCVECN